MICWINLWRGLGRDWRRGSKERGVVDGNERGVSSPVVEGEVEEFKLFEERLDEALVVGFEEELAVARPAIYIVIPEDGVDDREGQLLKEGCPPLGRSLPLLHDLLPPPPKYSKISLL